MAGTTAHRAADPVSASLRSVGQTGRQGCQIKPLRLNQSRMRRCVRPESVLRKGYLHPERRASGSAACDLRCVFGMCGSAPPTIVAVGGRARARSLGTGALFARDCLRAVARTYGATNCSTTRQCQWRPCQKGNEPRKFDLIGSSGRSGGARRGQTDRPIRSKQVGAVRVVFWQSSGAVRYEFRHRLSSEMRRNSGNPDIHSCRKALQSLRSINLH